MLRIKVLDANLQVDSDLFSKMDPYAQLDLDGQKVQTTSIKSGGKNPVWGEQFEFNAKELGEMNLKIIVKDQDIFKDDEIGTSQINIKQALTFHSMESLTVDLKKNGELNGSIRLSVFYNPSIAPQPQANTGFIL